MSSSLNDTESNQIQSFSNHLVTYGICLCINKIIEGVLADETVGVFYGVWIKILACSSDEIIASYEFMQGKLKVIYLDNRPTFMVHAFEEEACQSSRKREFRMSRNLGSAIEQIL